MNAMPSATSSLLRKFLLSFVIVAAVGCGGTGSSGADAATSPDLGGSSGAHPSGTVSVPTEHRPSPMACAPAPASSSACQGGAACAVDADCTAHPNGRCIGGGIVLCACAYDDCNSDGDCSSGQDCACHVTLREASGRGPNTCVPANCRSDADCASGFCSPSYTADYCQSYVDGYYCHTPHDECGVNADCIAGVAGYAVCAYQPSLGHWACVGGPFCAG